MNFSVEERLDKWNSEEANKYVAHNIFLVIYFIIGFVGNLVVLLVYKFKLTKENESKYFIPILAFVDLMACVIRSPFDLWKNLMPVKYTFLLACQIIWFFFDLFSFLSIFLLGLITFQRYLKVCRPFGSQLTLKPRRICLFVIFILSFSISAPFVMFDETLEIPNQSLNITGYICGANVIDSDSFLLFILYPAIVIIAVMMELVILNSLIAQRMFTVLRNENKRKAKSSTQNSTATFYDSNINESEGSTNETLTNPGDDRTINHAKSTNQSNKPDLTNMRNEKDHTSASRNFSLMIMVISIAFIISYIIQIAFLFSMVNDRYFWTKQTEAEASAFRFMDQLVTVNNIVNPFVYGFFDKKFRHAAKSLFC